MLVGCYTVEQATDTYQSQAFRPDARFKIITPTTNDGVLGILENQLLSAGFQIISDNTIRFNATSGVVTVATADTTVTKSMVEPASITLFKPAEADYIIRYDAQTLYNSQWIDNFSASVINVQTGAIEFSYNFRRGNNGTTTGDVRLVMKQFALAMKAAKKATNG
ncbi:MAG: hypothetical protein IPL65_20465 [Lewinellaceae bacterium]|nr:hypothetical protein [Lewinellaceae bacterium]